MSITKEQVKAVICDIEGTTTSIKFVKEILFPFARAKVAEYITEHWNTPNVISLVEQLCSSTEFRHFQHSFEYDLSDRSVPVVTHFIRYLIDMDSKLTPLKTLQGFVWKKGYSDGSIKGHVYSDVVLAFAHWKDLGIKIYIYSSGSVEAQKLLFGYSEYGNVLEYISGHFDTHVGHKQEPQSYVNIINELQMEAGEVAFLTDVKTEASAATEAGIFSVILDRPGNAPLTDDEKSTFLIAKSFSELNFSCK